MVLPRTPEGLTVTAVVVTFSSQTRDEDSKIEECQNLNHIRWDCKYHVVFIQKRRKKLLFGKFERHLGEVLHDLVNQKESVIVEGHLMPYHIRMYISIPPKYSVSHIVGFVKGKSAIAASIG